jgi:hypothetical protein
MRVRESDEVGRFSAAAVAVEPGGPRSLTPSERRERRRLRLRILAPAGVARLPVQFAFALALEEPRMRVIIDTGTSPARMRRARRAPGLGAWRRSPWPASAEVRASSETASPVALACQDKARDGCLLSCLARAAVVLPRRGGARKEVCAIGPAGE